MTVELGLGLGVGDDFVCVVVVDVDVVAVGVLSIYSELFRVLDLEFSMSVHCGEVGTESSVPAGGDERKLVPLLVWQLRRRGFGEFLRMRLLSEQHAFRVLRE